MSSAEPSLENYPRAIRQRAQPERDPTRTITRRRKFRASANKRWRTVRGDLRTTLSANDALRRSDNDEAARLDALAAITGTQRPLNSRTTEYRPDRLVDRGASDAEREAAFSDWFRDVLAGRIVGNVNGADAARNGEGWWETHIHQAYVRGLGLATADAKAVGLVETDDEDADPTAAFQTARHRDRFEAQLVQTFNDLENATDATHTEVVRELGSGLAAGATTAALTQGVTDRVRAVGETRTALVANTRVVDTVNRSIIEHAESLDAREVGVVPEAGERRTEEYKDKREASFATAGDSRVCAQCAFHQGMTATVEEIKKGSVEGPPIHPNCRCRWVILG